MLDLGNTIESIEAGLTFHLSLIVELSVSRKHCNCPNRCLDTTSRNSGLGFRTSAFKLNWIRTWSIQIYTHTIQFVPDLHCEQLHHEG